MMRSTLAAILIAAVVLTAIPALAQPAGGPEPEGGLWEFAPPAEGVSLDQLFQIIFDNTGTSIIYNPTDATLKNKKVFFTGKLRVPRDRIFDWLQAVLSYQKLMLVPLGPKGYKQWAVLNTNDPSIANSPVYVPEEDLVNWSDRDGVYIVSTITFKRLTDTTRARNALANLITRPAGRINDVPGTQSMVVGDFAPVVYSMWRLVRAMDVQNEEFEADFKVIRLHNAIATELEPVIQDLLAAAILPTGRPGGRGVQQTALGKPDPVIRADPRQEALVVYAVAEDMVKIEKIIHELDSEVLIVRNKINIYQCRHTLAGELAETLNELVTSTGLGTGSTGGRRQPARPTRPGQTQAGLSQGESEVVIVADTVANALLIQANERQYKEMSNLIIQLDIRRPQVLIEAALIELRVNDSLNFGVELAATSNVSPGSDARVGFGLSRFGLSSLEDVDGDGIPELNLPNLGVSGFTGGIFKEDQFPLIIQAFKGLNKAKALAMPSVAVDDGREAEIISNQAEPYSTTDTTNAGTDRENIEYVDAATILRISPHISSSNYLKLHIEVEVSSFGARPTPRLPPSTQSRQLKTDIVVPDRATLIMGGLIENRHTETVNKVPLLGDLPILGWFFRSTSEENFKTNLFIFVTPTILGGQGEDDADYFRTYHEITWERKLLADRLINEELTIYNSRFRGAEMVGHPKPETPEEELDDLEDSGLLDPPSFRHRTEIKRDRKEIREIFEKTRADAMIRREQTPGEEPLPVPGR